MGSCDTHMSLHSVASMSERPVDNVVPVGQGTSMTHSAAATSIMFKSYSPRPCVHLFRLGSHIAGPKQPARECFQSHVSQPFSRVRFARQLDPVEKVQYLARAMVGRNGACAARSLAARGHCCGEGLCHHPLSRCVAETLRPGHAMAARRNRLGVGF